MSNWRGRSREVLVTLAPGVRPLVLEGNLKEARKIVKDAYPFGMREYTPYKIWCEEVRRAIPGLYHQRKIKVDQHGTPLLGAD